MSWELVKGNNTWDLFGNYQNESNLEFIMYSDTGVENIVRPSNINKVKQILNNRDKLGFFNGCTVYVPSGNPISSSDEKSSQLENYIGLINISCLVCGNIAESNLDLDNSHIDLTELDKSLILEEYVFISDYNEFHHLKCLEFDKLLECYEKHSDEILSGSIS